MPERRAAWGYALATLTAIWTAIYLVIFQLVAEDAPALSLACIVLLSAAVCSTVISLLSPRSSIPFNRVTLRTAVIIAVCTVIGNVAVVGALRHTPAAVVSVVFQIQIFMIAGLERIMLAHRMQASMLIGAILAVAGIVVMNSDGLSLQADAGHWLGISMALIAAATFAVMLVVTRHAIERISILQVNLLRLWLAAVTLLLLPGIASDVLNCSLRTWLLAGGAGIAGLVLGRLSLMHAVRFIPATTTKLLTLTTPVFALLLAWLLQGNIPELHALIGSAIILGGVALPLSLAWYQEQRRLRNMITE